MATCRVSISVPARRDGRDWPCRPRSRSKYVRSLPGRSISRPRYPRYPAHQRTDRALRAGNVNVAADGRGDGRQVAFVGADYEVAAPEGAFDDAGVDDVGGAGAPGEGSGGPGPAVIENFDLASGQQPGELRLAGHASPALGDDRGWDGRHEAAQQQGTMAGPHRPLTALGGIQRPGVIGDPRHAERRVAAGWVTRAAHSSASAISSGVNGPRSASYWLTASRPARTTNSFRAVWATQAL